MELWARDKDAMLLGEAEDGVVEIKMRCCRERTKTKLWGHDKEIVRCFASAKMHVKSCKK